MRKRTAIITVLLISSLFLYYSCKKDTTSSLSDLVSIRVTPQDTVALVGETIQYKAIGVFADNSSKDITNEVSWQASPSGIVEISASGLATCIAKGQTYIVAAGGLGVVSGSICTNTDAAGYERVKVEQAYQSGYIGTNLSNCGWTGNITNCDAGIVTQDAHNKLLQRINYFRKMVGLPRDVTLDATKSEKCQKAALIFKSNNKLDHFPDSATFTCWTHDGYVAAGNSNIALGMHSVNAVTGYMDDFGANNVDVGHRRWLIYSKAKVMGDGSTDYSNAIWVLGNSGNPAPANMPEYIAYPPKGYVPGTLVFDRWSFSIPGAGFSSAAVEMKDATDHAVPVSIISTLAGYGDNSVVWEPSGINTNGPGDVSYTVSVSNVMVNGNPKTYTYTVTIIQPEKSKAPDYKTMKAEHPDWRIL